MHVAGRRMPQDVLVPAGVALIVLGMLLLLAGTVLSGDGDVEAGGVVFIGPIPLVFGSGRRTVWLSIAVAGLMVAALLLRGRP